MTESDNWEEAAVADQRPAGMSVEAARKILQVNPGLRAKGADTNFIIRQGTRSTEPVRSQPAAAELKKESPLANAGDVDHLFELANEQYQKEKRELESQLSILQAKLGGLKTQYCKAVMDKLATLDRNLSSPMTQVALQQHRATVAELGFTPQKYIEHLRQKR